MDEPKDDGGAEVEHTPSASLAEAHSIAAITIYNVHLKANSVK